MPKTIHGFMNIYRSGHFHRAGKPDTFDRHAGDLYADYTEAVAAIEPMSHYIATVAVQWEDPDEDLRPNPPESIPVPIGVSRRNFREHA